MSENAIEEGPQEISDMTCATKTNGMESPNGVQIAQT